jgi:hypothetical protein
MSDIGKPPPLPETPWEFFPDDDIRKEPEQPAEDAAMHIETSEGPIPLSERPSEDPGEVVHYLEDEDPEIADVSEVAERDDSTPEVEDLLIRQHYLPDDTAD